MNIRVYDDAEILPNLTVWRDVESLERFVWQTLHKNMYKRRDEWFAPINEGAKFVMWWIPEGHHPEMSEGRDRLEYLRKHGPSDHAFGWEQLPAAKCRKTAQVPAEHERAAEQDHRRHRSRRPAGVHAAPGCGDGRRRNPALLLP